MQYNQSDTWGKAWHVKAWQGCAAECNADRVCNGDKIGCARVSNKGVEHACSVRIRTPFYTLLKYMVIIDTPKINQ
jgi:hypothetical protein